MKIYVPAGKKLLATALLALILVVAFLCLSNAQQKFAPVNDELANIPGGINYLTTGRYTDPTHPPLLRYLLAIPLLIEGADPLPQDPSGLYSWQEYGRHFLFQNSISWQRILYGTRIVVILLSILFLVLIYRWTNRLWGRAAAFTAVLFISFEPNFLAHGQLATLDAGFSLAFYCAVMALWCYLTKPSWKNFLFLHLAIGFACMIKFTAVSLFLSAVFCLFFFRKKNDLHLKRFLLSPLILFFIIWATYLFQMKSGSEDVQIGRARDKEKIQAEIGAVSMKLGVTQEQVLSTKIPAYDFWKGFGMQTFHALFQDAWKDKVPPQYLLGAYEPRGWRSYFLWTFLLKSTLASILLLLLLAVWTVDRWTSRKFILDPVTLCLVISPFLLFMMCSMGTINIGHRYILPVYPFLAMGAGFLVAQKKRWLNYTITALLFLHIWSSCAAWPHHLSYFNELSRHGYYLADSNIDWGQDLLYLKQDLSDPRVKNTYVCGDIYSLVPLNDLGITLPPVPEKGMEALPAGAHTIYLSVNHFLNKSAQFPFGAYLWLKDIEPTRKVGTSILVFEITK